MYRLAAAATTGIARRSDLPPAVKTSHCEPKKPIIVSDLLPCSARHNHCRGLTESIETHRWLARMLLRLLLLLLLWWRLRLWRGLRLLIHALASLARVRLIRAAHTAVVI